MFQFAYLTAQVKQGKIPDVYVQDESFFKESADVDLVKLWHIDGGSEMDQKEKKLVPLVDLIAEKLNLKDAL